MRRWGPAMIALGYALLLAAWIAGEAPFAGPDEVAHQRRVLGIAADELTGRPGAYAAGEDGLEGARLAWVNATTRAVPIPGGLSPTGGDCTKFQPTRPATCVDALQPDPEQHRELTSVGTYPPLLHLLPGAVAHLGATPTSALAWARAAGAAVACVLLVAAVSVAWRDGRGAGDLTGLVVATTPMVVYGAAVVNTSGGEVVAAVTAAVAWLRVVDDDAGPGIWAVATAATTVLALARTGGPVWVTFLLAAVVAAAGPRQVVRALRDGGLVAAIAVTVVLSSLALALGWEAAYGPDAAFDPTPVIAATREAVTQLDSVTTQAVAAFGHLESRPPAWVYWMWRAIVAATVVLAFIRTRGRGKLVLAAAAVAAILVPIAGYVVSYRHTGFALQGRHALPGLVLVPVLAGSLLRRAPTTPWVLPAVAIPASVAHVSAWWFNARRHAVGTDGPVAFIADAAWDPAGGWWLWTVVAIAGGASLALGAVVAAATARRPRRRTARRRG